MRLPADARIGILALGLTAGLSACSLIPGGHGGTPALEVVVPAANGPAADYPVVLGDPFTVEGTLYTPADTLNYDAVGYAGLDAGERVTVAHRTLPLPSYVEVTSLETGKTILARVERRGPMGGSRLVALAPAAAAQLGGGEGTPVRVRRVNPQEAARAELRAGRPAPEPIETPKSLVEVLRRKLPATGAASLLAAVPPKPAPAAPAVAMAAPVRAAQRSAVVATQPAEPVRSASTPAASAPASPRAMAAYPLPALAPAPTTAGPVTAAVQTFVLPKPRVATPTAATAPSAKSPTKATPAAAASAGSFVVQAGTFSSRENAKRAADAIDGYVAPAGKLFRVRAGPFSNRGQAEAALAKVRAAGYSDARVYTAG